MKVNANVFYVASENLVYICWEKLNNIDKYVIYKNNNELISGTEEDFKRPRMFDLGHHTELFRPETIHWAFFKDENVEKFQSYDYQITAIEGGCEIYASDIISLKIE